MTNQPTAEDYEVLKKAHAMLQTNFDYVTLENERNVAMIEAAAKCNSDHPDYNVALGLKHTGQFPTCGNKLCESKHGNYIFLHNFVEDLIKEKKVAEHMCYTSRSNNMRNQETWTRLCADNNAISEQAVRDWKNMFEQCETLKKQYAALYEMKTDPLCRDTVIKELREKVAYEHGYALERNTCAYNSNMERNAWKAKWEEDSEKNKQLMKELADCHKTMALQTDTIDAFRSAQPEDLRTKRIGLCCQDYVCICKINDAKYNLSVKTQEMAKKDEKLQELESERCKLIRDVEYWKGEYDRSLQGDCDEQRERKKAKTMEVEVVKMEIKPKDLTATLSKELLGQFQTLFGVLDYNGKELDEATLYDDLLLDQPEHKRLLLLEEMYKACHNQQPLPDREKKKYTTDTLGDPKDSSRVGKRSFSACLRAMGGVFKRKGTKIMWTNIYTRHPPMFKRTQLVGV
jgi:hypothetical protein